MAEQLQLRIMATTTGHVVAVSGEVDIATSPNLAEALVQFADGDVIVDLSHVTFIDASGLSALIAAKRHIERRNGRLVTERVSPAVGRVFEIIGVDVGLCRRGSHVGVRDDRP